MTTIQTDFATLTAQWHAEREAALRPLRAELLSQLRTQGIEEVTVSYEGYGDSGNVEDVTVKPAGTETPPDLTTKLEEFGWDFAYDQHPGFENNEGGYGTLTWNVTTDSITLDHADRYIETSHTLHEGL